MAKNATVSTPDHNAILAALDDSLPAAIRAQVETALDLIESANARIAKAAADAKRDTAHPALTQPQRADVVERAFHHAHEDMERLLVTAQDTAEAVCAQLAESSALDAPAGVPSWMIVCRHSDLRAFLDAGHPNTLYAARDFLAERLAAGDAVTAFILGSGLLNVYWRGRGFTISEVGQTLAPVLLAHAESAGQPVSAAHRMLVALGRDDSPLARLLTCARDLHQRERQAAYNHVAQTAHTR